jgi:hypothetical protein
MEIVLDAMYLCMCAQIYIGHCPSTGLCRSEGQGGQDRAKSDHPRGRVRADCGPLLAAGRAWSYAGDGGEDVTLEKAG